MPTPIPRPPPPLVKTSAPQIPQAPPRRRRLRLFFIVLGVLLLTLVLVFLAGVPLGLTFLKDRIEVMAEDALGIPLHIDGDIVVTTGLKPKIEVASVWLGESEDRVLASVRSGKTQIELLPLLKKELRFVNLNAVGLFLDLSKPWPLAQHPPAQNQDEQGFVLYLPLTAEGQDVDLLLPAVASGDPTTLHLDKLTTEHAIGRKLSLLAQGNWLDEPFDLAIDADPLWRVPADLSNYRLTAKGTALSAELTTDAVFGFGQQTPSTTFALSLSAENTQALAKLTAFPHHNLEYFKLDGELALSENTIKLAAFQFDIPSVRGQADLQIRQTDQGPQVGGQVALSHLDLEQILNTFGGNKAQDQSQPPQVSGGIRIDASGIVNAPLNLHAASLDLVALDSSLSATIHSLHAAGSQWQGEASLTGTQGCNRLTLQLHGNQFYPQQFLPQAQGGLEIGGQINGVDLGGEICIDDPLDPDSPPLLRFTGGDGQLQISKLDDSVALNIESVEINSDDSASQIQFEGALIEDGDMQSELAFSLDTVGTHALLNTEHWPLTSSLAFARIQATLTGQVEMAAGQPLLSGELAIERDQSETPKLINLGDRISAYVALGRDQLEARDVDIRLGSSDLSGSIFASTTGGQRSIRLHLDADVIDLQDIRQIRGHIDKQVEQVAQVEQEYNWLMTAIPVVEALSDSPSIEFQSRIGRIDGTGIPLTDLFFSASVIDQTISVRDMGVRLDGIELRGSGVVDAREADTSVTLSASTNNADLGQFLTRRDVLHDWEIFSGSLTLDIAGSGSTYGELLDGLSLTANLRNTAISPSNQDQQSAPIELVLDYATAFIDSDDKLAIKGNGFFLVWPISFQLHAPAPAQILGGSEEIPISVSFNSEDDSGLLNLVLSRPISMGVASAQIEIQGNAIDTLDTSADGATGNFGPYSLSTRLSMSDEQLSIADLDIAIGESRIEGSVDLSNRLARPALDIQLHADKLQLADFYLPGKGQESERKPVIPGGLALTKIMTTFTEGWAGQIRGEMDVNASLTIDELVSQNEVLGSGQIGAELRSDSVTLGPVHIGLPQGSVDGSIFYEESSSVASYWGSIKIAGLDYGVISRIRDPDSTTSGLAFLDFEASGQAPSSAELVDSVVGTASFSIWPSDLSSRAIDLWASNLLLTVFGLINQSESAVNCAVGRFEIGGGVLTFQDYLIDTSKVIIRGRGEIDLTNLEVRLGFAPQAKSAAFFSVETPITVRGPLDDLSISIEPMDFAMTSLRLYYNLLYVPVQKLFGKKYPENGIQTCTEAMDWSDEEDQPPALRSLERVRGVRSPV